MGERLGLFVFLTDFKKDASQAFA